VKNGIYMTYSTMQSAGMLESGSSFSIQVACSSRRIVILWTTEERAGAKDMEKGLIQNNKQREKMDVATWWPLSFLDFGQQFRFPSRNG